MFEHVAKMSRISNPVVSREHENKLPPVRFRRLSKEDFDGSVLQLFSATDKEKMLDHYSYNESLNSSIMDMVSGQQLNV